MQADETDADADDDARGDEEDGKGVHGRRSSSGGSGRNGSRSRTAGNAIFIPVL
jgi:hypothetical protein